MCQWQHGPGSISLIYYVISLSALRKIAQIHWTGTMKDPENLVNACRVNYLESISKMWYFTYFFMRYTGELLHIYFSTEFMTFLGVYIAICFHLGDTILLIWWGNVKHCLCSTTGRSFSLTMHLYFSWLTIAFNNRPLCICRRHIRLINPRRTIKTNLLEK